jgi:hypothetical protein
VDAIWAEAFSSSLFLVLVHYNRVQFSAQIALERKKMMNWPHARCSALVLGSERSGIIDVASEIAWCFSSIPREQIKSLK